MHTQLSLNALSQSDMTNYLSFLKELEAFHEAQRLRFYPKIFASAPIVEVDWASMDFHYFRDGRAVEWWRLLPLVVVNLLLFDANRRGVDD